MAKQTKTKRTEIKDLDVQQTLDKKEMKELKGGKAGGALPDVDVAMSKNCWCGYFPKGHSGAHKGQTTST